MQDGTGEVARNKTAVSGFLGKDVCFLYTWVLVFHPAAALYKERSVLVIDFFFQRYIHLMKVSIICAGNQNQ